MECLSIQVQRNLPAVSAPRCVICYSLHRHLRFADRATVEVVGPFSFDFKITLE
jgi:hypothetical protein